MKKIVEGKRYDTETATLIGEYGSGSHGDFERIHEGLYRTRTKNYFVSGTGGPKTRYSVQVEQNCWSGSSDIYPLTKDEALEWAQAHLDAQEIEDEFAAMIADA